MQPHSLSKELVHVPLTIQDAIILIRRLDIRFLRVDRLCIVQDDEASIQHNISQMASIYAQAYFTIVATDGDSATGIRGVPGGSTPRKLDQEVVPFEDLSFLAVHLSGFYANHAGDKEHYWRGGDEREEQRWWHERAWFVFLRPAR